MNLNLTVDDVNVVLKGLGKVSLEEALGVYGKIQMQAQQELAKEKHSQEVKAAETVDPTAPALSATEVDVDTSTIAKTA